ncbi:MAG: hypothetical protein ACLTLQ_02460 [[Clostridium] scindens]
METIISSVEEAREAKFGVRARSDAGKKGQSLLCRDDVFEGLTMGGFWRLRVAGGGRCDRIVGKFTGQDTPACGFSLLGLSGSIMLLLENGFEGSKKRRYRRPIRLKRICQRKEMLKVLSMAKTDREAGKTGTDRQHEEEQESSRRSVLLARAEGYEEIYRSRYADSADQL